MGQDRKVADDKKMNASLEIYTDGGCSGNPGPGGWAYAIVMRNIQSESIIDDNVIEENIIEQRFGSQKNTTNNRMELTAVIEALQTLKNMNENNYKTTVYTDSQYVQKGITEWIKSWKKNNWKTKDKKPVKNQDLWEKLDALASNLQPDWKWVQGHAGNKFNEYCDQLTQQAIFSLA